MHPQPMTGAALFDLMSGPVRWQIVRLAYAEKIFDQLVTAKTPAEIANLNGFDERRTGLYLKALCSMGLAQCHDGQYQLRDDNAEILRSDTDKSLRSTLLAVSFMRGMNIETLLRNQEPDRNMNLHSEDFWDKSGDSLRSFHRGMAVDEMYNFLKSLPEWDTVKTIVDLGAGSEVLAERITSLNPEKSVTLVDLPPMVKRMEQALSGKSCAAQISTIAGDYNLVEFPRDTDLMWASMTLYFVKDMEDFFGRAYAALKPGGLFVSLHEGLSADRTQPECQVVGRLPVNMEMEDTGVGENQISDAMRKAGFPSVTITTVDTVVGPMLLTVGRVD